jgi:hypothetical protein
VRQGDDHALKAGEKYRVVSDPEEERLGFLRVIDESGEDHLFEASWFE